MQETEYMSCMHHIILFFFYFKRRQIKLYALPNNEDSQ